MGIGQAGYRKPCMGRPGTTVMIGSTCAGPPSEYDLEATTVWSFPDRGSWAGHNGAYPGNWSPYIPRNLILEYTRPGDLVIDPMMGSGTTLVEARLLGRHAIGLDIHPDVVRRVQDRLAALGDASAAVNARAHHGDARAMTEIPSGVADLVATHPPYANIIRYSDGKIAGDLSSGDIASFERDLKRVAAECYRVLAPGRYCAIMMGDTRRRGHYVPLTTLTLAAFLGVGFLLREDIVKLQWNVSSERTRWTERKYDFYRIAHERIFVFRKPADPTDVITHYWSSIRAFANTPLSPAP